jgi:hypothetical protein
MAWLFKDEPPPPAAAAEEERSEEGVGAAAPFRFDEDDASPDPAAPTAIPPKFEILPILFRDVVVVEDAAEEFDLASPLSRSC